MMPAWIRLLALLLATAAGEEECLGGTCEDEVASASLLARKRLVVREAVSLDEGRNGTETCAELELPGFKLQGCEAVGVGKSCVASCPEGKQGRAVRYFCFQALADEGKPPAALAPPFCLEGSGTSYPDGAVMALEWEGKGCLVCGKPGRACEVKAGAKAGDGSCTQFKVDGGEALLRLQENLDFCFDMRGGPTPGTWRCGGASHQKTFEENSATYPGTKALCVKSGRGKMCFNHLGRQAPFSEQKPLRSLFKSALASLSSGDSQGFLRKSYAQQICRAKLESGVPDDFWAWLRTQPMPTVQALFATFPAHPGHVRMFHAIREAVGHKRFQELNMTSFAIALSWLNRMKGSIDEAVQMPHSGFEVNDAGFLAKDRERVAQEMREGKHCGIQSNQCRDLHKCCGKPEDWKFRWPRDPSPSVREWVTFWLEKTAAHGEKLWMNPLNEVPWPFAAYIWPSPVKECEWVQRRVMEEKATKWYLYDHAFHKRVCAGGEHHPDSLPGIVAYGGVCGRMAQLEWRKTSCMGKPATMKGEPGHCAGFRFSANKGRYSTFNVLTDVAGLSTLQKVPLASENFNLEVVTGNAELPKETTVCLSCKSGGKACDTAPAGSEECTKFTVDPELSAFRTGKSQCLDMFGGPKPGLWRCNGGAHQKFTVGEGSYVIKAGRGTMRIRTTKLPKEVHVPKCLKCSAWKACSEESADSPSCTQFYYDAEKEVFKPVASDQCLDLRGDGSPGLWSCNYGGHQTAPVNEEGNPVIKSGRGRLELKRIAVKADESEKGRCIVCSKARSACTFAAAGSEECTLFSYEEEKKRLSLGKWGQCLDIMSGPRPGLWTCNGESHQTVEKDAEGNLGFKSKRGKMTLHVAGGGKLPDADIRWSYEGIHEVGCTKRNCHYYDVLGLDSKTVTSKKHKEAALALFESFNDHERQGLFPTAHDEARLAASMVFSLKDVLPAADLEPVLAWALKRNPASYEAWELAASFNSSSLLAGEDMPSRDDLASHDWYKQLALLNLGEGAEGASGASGAEGFARRHLLDGKKWLKLPQLRKSLVDRLCGALSEGLLAELGEASEQCILLRRLADGKGWQDALDEMLGEDALCSGNKPSEAFQSSWEVLTRIAMAPSRHGQGAKLEEALQYLLERLSVGYINERSQTFYAEYGRVLLSSPYAHVLQVAGAVLAKEAREKVLESAKAVLEKPLESPERLRASEEALKDGFLAWAAGKKAVKGAEEETSAADTVNGGSDGDSPNPEVMGQMLLDRDEEMELGAAFWHEKEGNADEEKRYQAEHLLKMLLRLQDDGESSPQSAAADGGLAASASLGQEAVEEAPAALGAAELIQHCMDDLLAS